MSNLVSTKKAMNLLGVGATTIRRWNDQGKLKSVRTPGGHRRFYRADIDRLVGRKTTSSEDCVSCDFWVQQLLHNNDLTLLIDEIQRLCDELGGWFSAADFLGKVLKRIGILWADGEWSVIQEHIATYRLSTALNIVSSEIHVQQGAPVCVLAALSNELHIFGLSLSLLCLKALGVEVLWIGTNTPTDELADYIISSEPQLLGLSASCYSTDYGFLKRAYQDIAVACQTSDTQLILGGSGTWPTDIAYGHRCHSFKELQIILEQMDLKARK